MDAAAHAVRIAGANDSGRSGVGCRTGGVNDTFTWTAIIKELDVKQTPPTATGKQWSSQRDFAAPVAARRLYPWEKLAQVLLETNELTFVN